MADKHFRTVPYVNNLVEMSRENAGKAWVAINQANAAAQKAMAVPYTNELIEIGLYYAALLYRDASEETPGQTIGDTNTGTAEGILTRIYSPASLIQEYQLALVYIRTYGRLLASSQSHQVEMRELLYEVSRRARAQSPQLQKDQPI